MKKSLFLILFCSFYIHINAQENNRVLDSLQINLLEAETDSLRVIQYLELAKFHSETDIKRTKRIFNEALDICLKQTNLNTPFWSEQLAYIYDSLGVLERKESNYNEALSYYLKALKIKEQQHDSTNIGRSYHNIAMLFNGQRDFNKAVSYMRKALPMRYKFNDSVSYGISLNMYGYFKYRLKEKDSAIIYYEKAKRFFNTDSHITDVNNNIAQLHVSNQAYEKAIVLYKENLKIFKANNQLSRVGLTARRLARAYRKQKQYPLALKYLDTSEYIARKLADKKLLLNIYINRTKIDSARNNFRGALESYKTYRKYKDTIFNIDNAIALNTLELNYKFEKEKLEDSLQFTHENKRLQLISETQESRKKLFAGLWSITIIAFISLLLLFIYRRKLNREHINKGLIEKELLNEKLEILRYRAEKLTVDNKMRLQFKIDFLAKIKDLKKASVTTDNKNYQSLIVELQSQINTEGRLGAISESLVHNDLAFQSKINELFPELTKSEREICNLIRMNLSLKEIMNIRNTTLSSIKSSRYRIRKKMNVPKGNELELFIQNLAV